MAVTKLALKDIKVFDLLNKTINYTNPKWYNTKYTLQEKSSKVLVRTALTELIPPDLFSNGFLSYLLCKA